MEDLEFHAIDNTPSRTLFLERPEDATALLTEGQTLMRVLNSGGAPLETLCDFLMRVVVHLLKATSDEDYS